MENKGDTIQFTVPKEARTAEDVLMTVYAAMRERGYDPVNQIVGYLLS
ncbi:MAG: IreB family regulatory phosphoprotein, partial [Clostridia bacterium]|nr:IreB family regulatory phosphoprotein [Clostridia bacterium]